MKNKMAVVLGRNYTSVLGMVRALGEAGYDITVIRSVKKMPNNKLVKRMVKNIFFGGEIEKESKYVKKYLYTVEPNREHLIELLLKEFEIQNEMMLIVPTDDYTASTIDLYQDKLVGKFQFPNINLKSGEIVKYMDKDTQKHLARECGLNVAQGYMIFMNDGHYEIPEGIIYPVFTKPQVSFEGNKNLMKKCNSEKELCDILDIAAKQNGCKILVEEFIEIENEYGILGCSINNTIYMPGIIKKIRCGTHSHKGVTMLGEVTPLCEDSELHESLEKFIKKINFNGLFDIDLYENNGKIYFNELNLRFGAAGYGITQAGTNLPQIFAEGLNGKCTDFCTRIKACKFISEKVALEELSEGYMSYDEYRQLIRSADVTFIKSDNDKRPYRAFKRKELQSRAKNWIKKWRKNDE